MMLLRLLIAFCSSVGLIRSWSTTFVQDERIENPNSPPEYYDTEIKAHWHTHDKHTYVVCWKSPTGNDNGDKVCADPVSKGKVSFMFTFVGHRFEITQDDTATPGSKWPWPLGGKKKEEKKSDVTPVVVFEIVGGQHDYHVDQIYAAGTGIKSTETGNSNDGGLAVTLPVVYVRSPDDCSRGAWESVGGLWRDALRRSAYRHGVALCMCGGWNHTTSFTGALSNPETPQLLTPLHQQGACNCDRENYYYDLWFPCGVDHGDGDQLLHEETCSDAEDAGDGKGLTALRTVSDNEVRAQRFEQTRLFVLHATMMVDRISMKGKMWESLKAVYGFERAGEVMPKSFYTIYPEERQMLLQLCKGLQNQKGRQSGEQADHYFIVKNEALHRQQGISITSASHIVADAGVIRDEFTFATQFLPRPYLVKGYKLNMRRYMIAVCTGGRLRGYVHDDGKNIYTKNPYVEPWTVKAGKGKDGRATELDLLKGRLDDLITTGYVPPTHYDDKPLSGLEFFSLVTSQGGNYTMFQRSMWTRLALSLHASRTHEDFDLCEVEGDRLQSPGVPQCLHNAVRFQHFGCDFHVDDTLTGYESRMFECNKGPDMHPHNFRDGQMKRDVAADIMSFIGFQGDFDGSDEAARTFRMNLVYDSETFSVDDSFAFLEGLNVLGKKDGGSDKGGINGDGEL